MINMSEARKRPSLMVDAPTPGAESPPAPPTGAASWPGPSRLVLDHTTVLALSMVDRELGAHRRGGAVAGLVSSLLAALADHDQVEIQLAVRSAGEADRSTAPSQADSLIQQMTAQAVVPSESAARQAQRNAAARAELLAEFGALAGEDIGEQHSRARNRHALAARWRKERRVFGVMHQGRTLYPGFQFDRTSGALRPAIRDVLAALPTERMSDWEVALWWTAANGWLGGRRPVDLLDQDSAQIVSAAARLAEPGPL